MYFDKLKPAEKELIFKGLKRLVEDGAPGVFHNADPGHPTYVAGAAGKRGNGLGYVDGPSTNPAFLMLRELSQDLKDSSTSMIWWYDFSNWQDFCKLAVKKHRERKGTA